MYVVGIMSGTSADGVDAAVCYITGTPGQMQARVVHGKTTAYDIDTRQAILESCDPATSRVDEIARLNTKLAEVFAQAVVEVVTGAGLTMSEINLIGSHGQTLWHNVREDGIVDASFQVGEAAVIAERTGVTTINNFRARDIAAGGQGAPLTTYVDWLLLRHDTHWRAIQNIGGMGNVTFLPPLSETDVEPIGFDTGPGNALLDTAVYHYTGGAQTYDRDGRLAQQGRIDESWLEDMLAHPYYQRDFPKTTGRELFGTTAAYRLISEGESRGLTPNEIIATLTALTATNIADAYQRFAPAPISEVVLGGGGGHNPVMVGLLRELLNGAVVHKHEDLGMSSDFKEALVFAVLAYETWHGRYGALPAFTGAAQPTLLGQVTPGDNFESLLAARREAAAKT
ncbi:MAG: anhydro-N-acetylmuramic acid kinase [Chloroflexota bacterium]